MRFGLMHYIVSLLLVLSTTNLSSTKVIQLNTSCWEQLLQDEWLIEFFAPWCPACRTFAPVWEKLSNIPDLSAKVAAVDITENSVLSLTFRVTRLPTVFHIKDGVVRTFYGQLNIEKVQEFLLPQYHSTVAPIPWYYSPTSLHMLYMSRFFQLTLVFQNLHKNLVDAGYSYWLSFIIICLGTIVIAVALGMSLVIISDCFVPPRPQILRFFRSASRQDDGTLDVSRTQDTDDLVSGRLTNLTDEDDDDDDGDSVTVRRRTVSLQSTDVEEDNGIE